MTHAAEIMILMSGNEWLDARNKVTATTDPNMVRIYEWMLYREDYEGLPFPRIANFIENNPQWPNQTALKKTAERNMPPNLPPQATIGWFERHTPLTGRGMILLLNAAQQTNQIDHAIKIIASGWVDADISNNDFQSLYNAIGNRLPADIMVKRLDNLLFAKKYTAARQQATLMGRGYPQLSEARIALAEEKPNVSGLISNIPSALRNDTGLLFERLRWRRRHDEDKGAIEILNMAPKLDAVSNPSDWWKERHIMIRRSIENHDFKTAYLLAAHHGHLDTSDRADAEWISGWLALRFLNQPQVAKSHFNTMISIVGTAISKSRGNYWMGRAEEQSGNKEKAQSWYVAASAYSRTYYGQLALKKLGYTKSGMEVITPTPQDISKIESSGLLTTALIAHVADLKSIHSQLITALIATLSTPGEYMSAARKLKQHGDETGSFRVAKAASWKNYDLGPYAYPKHENYMSGLTGDHALYHAIIRQESQFDTQARSPAGALGLMQLMPATAKETAHKIGTPHQTGWLTSRPDHNILLGSNYINRLLTRFDHAIPLAIAGYNAGPSRVDQWVEKFGDPRTEKIDWVDWVELIPVGETRNYVQRVMENYFIYTNSY